MARKRRKNAIEKTRWRVNHKPPEQPEKLYYSVGEVAKIFGVEETQLRYWEEHTSLSPKRSKGSGARMYSQDDLELVAKIKYLLQEKGFSLAAVEDQLRGEHIQRELEMRNKLFEIRERVEQLRKMVQQQLQQIQNDGEELR